MERLRKRLTFSNVVSVLALFVALGGSAYAASHLGKNAVGSKQLKKNSITTAKIKNGAVTGSKIKSGAITGQQLANGSVTGAQVNASTLGTVPTAQKAFSLSPPENWHVVGASGEPAFQTGWKNSSPSSASPETVAFYKDQEGVVHLRGMAIGGSGIVFQLPAGYRPASGKFLEFVVPCTGCGPGAAAGILTIYGPDIPPAFYDGAVAPPGITTSFEGVTFRAGS